MFFRLTILIFVGFLVCASSLKNDSEITISELKSHITYLASDKLKGRKSGSKEANSAANYIYQQFKNYGLEFPVDKGFQCFEVLTDINLGKKNFFHYQNKKSIAGVDYIPLAFSKDTSISANIVFAGYGFEVKSNEIYWNDFDKIEVKDKWVLMFTAEPKMHSRNPLFSDNSDSRYKAMIAADKGAAGVIFVYPPSEKKENQIPALVCPRNDSRIKIPVVHISHKLADELLKPADLTLSRIEQLILDNKKPYSFETEINIELSVELIVKKAQTCNVIAYIEGNHEVLKNEFIVVGAHYDHLGMGGYGSGSRMPDTVAVHNGADDNASGVAGLIELAGKLAFHRNLLDRSVVFIAFSAEEMGLLGSNYFVNNSFLPLNSIKTMINLDMIGRQDTITNFLLVGGLGTAVQHDSIVSFHAQKYNIDLKKTYEGLGPSDHASFYAKNIPVLFFSSGAHHDYHTPFDDEDKIIYPPMINTLNFLYDLTMSYATLKTSPVFMEAGPKEASSNRGYTVTLGIMPDFSATDIKGLKIQSVRKGGPASVAGLINGDIIISINENEITNIYDYTHRLKMLRKGDIITVGIIRNSTEFKFFIQL